MTAARLIEQSLSQGVELRIEEGRLIARGAEDVVDLLMPHLKDHKEQVIECLLNKSYERHCRLCRLIDEVVNTRFGRGRLWQVFHHRVAVVIEPGRVTFMHPSDVALD